MMATAGSRACSGIQSGALAILCALGATSGLACGVDADRTGREAEATCAGQTNPDGSCAEDASEAAPIAASGCVTAVAGGGFVALPVADARVLATLTFTVTPSGPGIDAVIGLSAGVASRFDHLATAVRLAPSGVIDARDGAAYRADLPLSYSTQPLDFRVIADVTTHRYSVFQGGFRDAQELARQYAFRPSQAGVTHLDHVAIVVDGGVGSVQVCQAGVAASRGIGYSREGRHAVLPLGGGAAVISDGATTRKLDAAGHVVGSLPVGGELAIDVVGNLFVARIEGTTLTVEKYDPALALRWRTTSTVLAETVIAAMATEPNGAVEIGMVTRQEGSVTINRYTAGGSFNQQMWGVGEIVGFEAGSPITAWNDNGTLRVQKTTSTGVPVWQRAFTGSAGLTAIAGTPDHGVVLGGELFTPIDFGGGTLPLRRTDNGPLDGFVVKLAADGSHAFSRKTGYTTVGGIAANGSQIVVSSTEQTQFHYQHLQRFDPSGAPIAGPAFDLGLGENGFGHGVAIDASGRVWWNFETQWPLFPRWTYFAAIDP